MYWFKSAYILTHANVKLNCYNSDNSLQFPKSFSLPNLGNERREDSNMGRVKEKKKECRFPDNRFWQETSDLVRRTYNASHSRPGPIRPSVGGDTFCVIFLCHSPCHGHCPNTLKRSPWKNTLLICHMKNLSVVSFARAWGLRSDTSQWLKFNCQSCFPLPGQTLNISQRWMTS